MIIRNEQRIASRKSLLLTGCCLTSNVTRSPLNERREETSEVRHELSRQKRIVASDRSSLSRNVTAAMLNGQTKGRTLVRLAHHAK